MPRIALRAYNREIEALIEGGKQLDEAVAHCMHILKEFPKHLDTYRLLGKAYLESKRYDQAVDIFQRVLVAVPEDFVSHVGMSIVADDQGKLDDAIWHMERAFEVQPSNAAIQAELQRLFGRRDGVEPPKIRLTRGALAHMYVQGELYPQAISEIRAVLTQDQNRMDMRVLLARAYSRAGQRAEATEVCGELLAVSPYCLDANRLMAEPEPGAEATDSIREYRRRVFELEPYAEFASGSMLDAAAVEDDAVSLERLENEAQPPSADVDVSLDLGAAEGAASDEEAFPSWLKPSTSDSDKGGPSPSKEPEIPDFMRDRGWRAIGSDTGVDRGVSESAAKDEGGPMPADLPDWVKALAPSEDGGVGADQRSALEDSVAQDSDAWPLAEKEPSIRSADASRPPADSDEPPDWLKDLAIGAETQAPESPPLQAGWSGGASMPGEEAHKDSTETGAGKDPLAWLEDLVEGPDGGRQDSGPTEAAPAGWEPATPPSADIEVGRQPAVNSTSFDRTGGDRQNSPDAQVSPQPARDWMSGLSGEGAFDGMDTEGEASAEPIMGEPDLAGWSGAENEGLQTHDADEPSARTPTAADSRKHTDGDMSAKQGSAVDLPEWLAGLDREESGSAPEDQAVASPRTIPEMLRTEESARPHGSMHDTSASGPAESLEATGEDLNARRQSLEPEPETARSSTPAPASAVDAQALPASAISSPGAASKKSFRAERKVSTPTLGGAKDELGRGNIAVALDIYSRLIRKGKSLEDIILELRDALHRYPVEVPIWQALGDAYMRANRLQEALDAYTKAEELLR